MAFTKSQLEGLKNTLIASNQPILASQHREQIQSIIDEMFDSQTRANVLVGVQADSAQGGSDTFLIFRSGQAYQIPLSLLSATTLASLGDVLIASLTDGDTLVYNSVDDRWENQNIFLGFSIANLQDVNLSNLTNGDILRYNSSTEEWDNTSLATILSDYALLTDLDDYQLLSEKGQANGYAQLDSGAKIPTSIIPDSVLGQVEYKGTWNASTNTPTLPSTPVKKGDYYVVSVGGTQFGIDFLVGDWIISNGSIWEKVDNTDAVTSVFGRLGNVVANASDYSAFYVTLDTAQTITAQKTFTNSGSSSNIIVNHTSGSGIALDIAKAGNGEGLRVVKSSGSGNAVTITGGNLEAPTIVKTGGTSSQFLMADGSVNTSVLASGAYLPLTGGTLTGALNGTSATFSLDSSFNGVDIGRGGGNLNTNTAVGLNAGVNNTTGADNSFFGVNAGISNSTGGNNSFFGRGAGQSNTEGAENSIFGVNAGFSNTTGAFNSFFGRLAGFNNTTGASNSFFGFDAGRFISGGGNLTIANNSVFLGFDTRALADNQTNQIVIGHGAIGQGSNTVTIGNSSILSNRFFGTMRIGTINNGAGDFITTDANGVLTKRTAAETLSDIGAAPSVAGGYLPLSGGTLTGALNGTSATFSLDSSFNGVKVGRGGGNLDTNTAVGFNAGQSNTTGANNSFFGRDAGQNNTTGAANSFFGRNAGLSNTTGAANSFFGVNAGISNSTGGNNSFFGVNAGLNNTTGAENSFFGRDAGVSNTTGSSNSFFGLNAGLSNTTGAANSFFGIQAGQSNTTGAFNSFFGLNAGLSNTTGNSNSFFGLAAGQSNTTGNNNSFFGLYAGLNNTTGGSNSFFGRDAGRFISGGGNLTVANNSVFLGFDTRALADSQTNQIVIGHNAIGVGSNSVVLGNTSIATTVLRGNVGIGTTAPTSRLNISGVGTGAAIDWTNTTATTGRSYRWVSLNTGGFAVEDLTDSGAERMRITSTGNVGIGTTAPYQKLVVDGHLAFTTGTAGTDFTGDIKRNGIGWQANGATGNLAAFINAVNTPNWGADLAFYTRLNTAGLINERLRITSTGNVGIGTTAPTTKLDVNGDVTITDKIIHSGDTNTAIRFPANDTVSVETNGSERMRITSAGSMGLGLTNPASTAGRFEASNDIVAFSSSDIRWKNNIQEISNSIEKLSNLRGISFDWIEDEPNHGNKGHDYGVIAQEVEALFPEMVQTRESGMKAVKYDRLIPVLIEAIKELNEKIKTLESKL